jgi:hypothetical protein
VCPWPDSTTFLWDLWLFCLARISPWTVIEISHHYLSVAFYLSIVCYLSDL